MPILLFLLACSFPPSFSSAGDTPRPSGSAGITAAPAGPTAPPDAAAAAAALPPIETGRYTVGAVASHGRLAVWPVLDTRPAATGDYVTLADGLAAGTVQVTEKDGGDVPRLSVENRGKVPVFLAAGDVVTGGRQDRVVVADVVVAPGHTEAVAVNCVEHGRWSGGQSFGYGGKAEYGLKETVQVAKDQSRTWEKVAELNGAKQRELAAQGVSEAELAPSTGTYRASLEADEVRQAAQPFEAVVTRALTGDRVVGLVVALDGQVVGSELFGSPTLLQRSREAIARSVALDAVSLRAGSVAPPPDAAAAAFLADAVSSKPTATAAAPVGVQLETLGYTTQGYDLREDDGDLVHKTTYRK